MLQQYKLTVPGTTSGCRLITPLVEKALGQLPKQGLLHLFLQHTSAAIIVNENYDDAVMRDFEAYMEYMVPRGVDFLTHTIEGPDDMPSHVKTAITGFELTIPVVDYELGLGQWQGIWLCEYRDQPRDRNILLTLLT